MYRYSKSIFFSFASLSPFFGEKGDSELSRKHHFVLCTDLYPKIHNFFREQRNITEVKGGGGARLNGNLRVEGGSSSSQMATPPSVGWTLNRSVAVLRESLGFVSVGGV